MKKIIKNKVYDTDTAKLLAEYDSGNRGDFHWYCEELYQKKTGEFFIYGEGNAASPYSQKVDTNTWSGSCAIVPMSYDEAREWAEKKLDADEYISIFGEPEEDDSRQSVNISLSAQKAAQLKQAAAKAGMTVSAYVESLIV